MKVLLKYALGFALILICLHVHAQTETGKASFYHSKFEGHGTSSGEVFRQSKFTCAHKSLPFGTWLKVTCTKNNNVVYVRVNDRLPKSSKRCIDLTLTAATKLDFVRNGLTQVNLEVVEDAAVPEHFKSDIELKSKRKKK
jgi:rare lipoprotein A